jgi:hypothetical protein
MTADNTTLARFIANYQSEREGAALYREMAAHEGLSAGGFAITPKKNPTGGTVG